MANGGYNTTEIIPIQYSALVTLISNSKLVPGQQYRITDYNTTTVQTDTQSAGNQFDVIVRADSNNVLNDNAYAIQHTTSSSDYFYGQNLAAWELKYDINNDTNKYAWADSTNGKGVIFWMKDEYENECGYDFKNIQFKRYKVTARTDTTKTTDFVGYYFGAKQVGESSLYPSGYTISSSDSVWRYTFNLENSGTKDFSLNKYVTGSINCHENKIARLFGTSISNHKKQYLGNIVFLNSDVNSRCQGNHFDIKCHTMTFGNYCYSNSFGNNCNSNSFGNNCNFNSFGNYCYSNSFGNYCNFNSFGNYCYSNSFGNNCNSNSFGNSCGSNSFGNSCYSNSFGNYCYSNSFGNNCNSNSFGNNCNSNSFGNYCNSNSFGNNCNSNSFGNDCYSNSFGNYCNSNSFGNNCKGNNIPTTSGAAKYDEGISFKSPKFNFAYADSDYGFVYSGDINTDDEDNPRIYVEVYAFNNGDFDISVDIPYEFSGDITAKSGSSLSGTYSLTVPANESVHFEISAIVSSVDEAEGSWEFNGEFDYLLGNTNIHYVGHYEY